MAYISGSGCAVPAQVISRNQPFLQPRIRPHRGIVFGYYCNLALRNLRLNVVFTALMIISIGDGIGA